MAIVANITHKANGFINNFIIFTDASSNELQTPNKSLPDLKCLAGSRLFDMSGK